MKTAQALGDLYEVAASPGVVPGQDHIPACRPTVPWEAFAKNEDWRGAAIRDSNDPIAPKAKQEFSHVVWSLLPFSL